MPFFAIRYLLFQWTIHYLQPEGVGFGGFFLGRVGQDCDLVFRGNGRGISRRQETISGGGGGREKSGVEGGARRILDLVF